jgi:dephospho-CoA kinase
VRVGLTGGIGSGKSEVARRLGDRGAVLVDADVAARAVVEPGTPGYQQILATFDDRVVKPDGTLNREWLATVVFNDPSRRADLNAIVHPLVGEWMAATEKAALEAGGPQTIVVHDVPLLAENGLSGVYDTVIVVDVPPELQVARLIRGRQMSIKDIRERMGAQATREQRLAIAGIVIDNSGTLGDLDRRVDEVWADLVKRAAG